MRTYKIMRPVKWRAKRVRFRRHSPTHFEWPSLGRHACTMRSHYYSVSRGWSGTETLVERSWGDHWRTICVACAERMKLEAAV